MSADLDELRTLRRVRDRIDREFDRPLSVEELAAGVFMSAGHLSRRFKAAYGESPYSFLMTRRVERAMALIKRGGVSITDICYGVGFNSPGTFSTRFHELVGMSPSEYRRASVHDEYALPSIVVKNAVRPVRNREVPDPRSG